MTNNTTIQTSKCSDSDSGYQVAGGYTIQPLTTCIDIKTEDSSPAGIPVG